MNRACDWFPKSATLKPSKLKEAHEVGLRRLEGGKVRTGEKSDLKDNLALCRHAKKFKAALAKKRGQCAYKHRRISLSWEGGGARGGGQAIAYGVRRGFDWQEETSAGLRSMTEGLVSDGSEEVSRG